MGTVLYAIVEVSQIYQGHLSYFDVSRWCLNKDSHLYCAMDEDKKGLFVEGWPKNVCTEAKQVIEDDIYHAYQWTGVQTLRQFVEKFTLDIDRERLENQERASTEAICDVSPILRSIMCSLIPLETAYGDVRILFYRSS